MPVPFTPAGVPEDRTPDAIAPLGTPTTTVLSSGTVPTEGFEPPTFWFVAKRSFH